MSRGRIFYAVGGFTEYSNDRDQSQSADPDAGAWAAHDDAGSAALLQDEPLGDSYSGIECRVDNACAGLVADCPSSSCASADEVAAEPTPACDGPPSATTSQSVGVGSGLGLAFLFQWLFRHRIQVWTMVIGI